MRSPTRRASPYGLARSVTAAPSSSTYPLPSVSNRPSTRRSPSTACVSPRRATRNTATAATPGRNGTSRTLRTR